MKKYCCIITSEKDKCLDFYAENPWEGKLEAVVYFDTVAEWELHLGQYEGLFYQLYENQSEERFSYGIIDSCYPTEDIKERDAIEHELVSEWVDYFNSYPTSMINTLIDAAPDEWEEVTTPCVGKLVYVPEIDDFGEIVEIGGLYKVKVAKDRIFSVSEVEVQYDDYIPIWGTMWSFINPQDELWLKYKGIKIMSECGFRVFKSERWGYFFGIDGGGYSFYDKHWIPLYKQRNA